MYMKYYKWLKKMISKIQKVIMGYEKKKTESVRKGSKTGY